MPPCRRLLPAAAAMSPLSCHASPLSPLLPLAHEDFLITTSPYTLAAVVTAVTFPRRLLMIALLLFFAIMLLIARAPHALRAARASRMMTSNDAQRCAVQCVRANVLCARRRACGGSSFTLAQPEKMRSATIAVIADDCRYSAMPPYATIRCQRAYV